MTNKELACIAAQDGERFFHGSACLLCGNTLRYAKPTQGAKCVLCQRARVLKFNREYRATEYGRMQSQEASTKYRKGIGRKNVNRLSVDYAKRNPHIVAGKNARRRQRLRIGKASLSQTDWVVLRSIYQLRQTAEDVDHYLPISRGGVHHPKNLWIVPASYNRSKGDRFPTPLDHAGFELFQATVVDEIYSEVNRGLHASNLPA